MKEVSKDYEIVNTPNGIFLINERDLIGNFIKNYGFWEKHLQLIYEELIKPTHICVDAGANLGYHTIQFGKLAKKVYAFEPQPLVYNQLCTNILFNDLNDIIIPIREGLGDKVDTKQMWSIVKEEMGNDFYNWGGRGIEHEFATHNSTELRETDRIKVTTLDSLNLEHCDFIKIDIQGYEYYAFLGAKNTLINYKPTIFLENSLVQDNKEEVMNKKTKTSLTDLGYEFYRIYIGNNDDCILIHPDNSSYKELKNTIEKLSTQFNIIQDESRGSSSK